MENNAETSDLSIGNELALFIKYIDALASTLPPTLLAIGSFQQAYFQQIAKYFEENVISQEVIDGKLIIKAKIDDYNEPVKLFKDIEKTNLADKLILRSFIISLISQYDAFLGRLIRSLFLVQPESLNISEKNITFAQLQSFGSIEDAKEYIMEKEVETVLRKSHSEQFDWLERKFDIKLREGLSVWSAFIEVTERRNLFVHNNGVVSSQYMNICKENKVEIAKDIQLGSQLEATTDYFKKAYESVFEIGVKLAHVLWRKVQPADREKADQKLNGICYDLLAEERFRLACILLDFAVDMKKFSSEQRKRTFIVNRAQAYKWAGDFEKAKKIITNEDWSAASDDFKLAEAIILDDYDRAYILMRKIGSDGDVDKKAYREWPLFRDIRKTEEFQKIFEVLFGELLFPLDIDEEQIIGSKKIFKFVFKDVSGILQFTEDEIEQYRSHPGALFDNLIQKSIEAVQPGNVQILQEDGASLNPHSSQ